MAKATISVIIVTFYSFSLII